MTVGTYPNPFTNPTGLLYPLLNLSITFNNFFLIREGEEVLVIAMQFRKNHHKFSLITIMLKSAKEFANSIETLILVLEEYVKDKN